jgi:glyoxylase-like metal-dependent hydrolase (beta-lactamase superfamily II)
LTKSRSALDAQLESAGCKPGDLALIVLTHGDFDHIGNCRYVRDKFKAKTAMHCDDAGMAERGDMFWNRKKGNFLIKTIANLLFPFKKDDRFSPDILLKDGDGLVEYGLKAVVLYIPGHSKGSIGVLTENGDLFCGDLLENIRKPAISSLTDDPEAAKTSLAKLENSLVHMVYPGHGKSFLMKEIPRGQ